MKKETHILIYEREDGNSEFQVKLVNNTIWLSQKQMAELFDKDSDTISLHLKNIYKSGELEQDSTTEDYSEVRKEGKREVNRRIKHYNLDAIISVGYRVNSIKGTQFRIWATKVLKQHVEKGYSINQRRLDSLKQSVKLIDSATYSDELTTDETTEIIRVLADYALGLDILDGYDHQNIEINDTNPNTSYRINYKDAKEAISQLRTKFGGGDLFGNEKDQSFKSSISTIDQTFDGNELYPSIEAKAANLLYFVVKNHSFSDGNKRIAAWLFVWYLSKNKHLYSATGQKKIANNALATLTLMIALSKPDEKELLIKVIINSINKQNEAL